MAVGGAFALSLTFVFTALFTFRYYILHTRIGMGQVTSPFRVEHDGRYFYLGDYEAYVAVQAAVDEVAALAEPGDRLLVGPNDLRRTWYSDAFIYWLLPELEPATYYIEMDPGLANAEGSSLAADVASADWVILTGFWDGWLEPNASMEYGSDAPNQVLARRVLRGRHVGGPPGHPLRQALTVHVRHRGSHRRPGSGRQTRQLERQAAPDGAGEVAEHG